MSKQSGMSPKKAILIISVSFIALVGILSAVYMYFNNNSTNSHGEYLDIENIDEYTQGKPSDEDTLDYIKHALFTTVNLNTDQPVESRSITDIVVREGSFSQKYDEDRSIHTVEFIVDIESLKQSYRASYQWSDENRYSEHIDEWGTAVRCLPVDELIYGDFDCRDLFTEMSSVNGDSKLESILPHRSEFYTIRSYPGEGDGHAVISIQIMSNNNSERTQKRFNTYKKEATDWLESQDIELDTYTIEYRNFSNRIVEITQRKR